jgi:demethylmenaquinone methyltransferase/2-methoxy-6-polyprenyl-1,4-benzoquinol methylase
VIGGERFARLATTLVVKRPVVWRLLRRPMRRMFNELAPRWDSLRTAGALDAYREAVALVDPPPRRALDVGTGTGAGALEIARRWPDVEVLGVDLAERMIAEARRKTPPELADRVRFAVADAARLPYEDGAFDLITLLNVVPFFDELARVARRGGTVVVSFSLGRETPIWVPPDRLRGELARAGFADFRELEA